ncbi:hypothetical protein CPC08DRAFT_324813 [Agrocybe pediades]|nr:hypothetical protein CPC08DRAFT_324813 [Agrocybe pediades]
MRFTGLSLPLLLPLAAPLLAAAQDQNSNSSDSSSSSYSQECISALQSAGFTKLADTLTSINDTDQGRALWEQLSSGRNFTVFAPNDAAFQNVSSDISGNSTLLAEYLSYHFVQGDFTNSSYTNSSSSSSGGGGAAGGGASTVTESTTQSQSASSGAAATSTATSTESSTQSTTETSTQTSTSTSTISESTSTSTSTDTNTATSTATDTATSTAVATTTAALFERLFGRQDQSGGNSSSSSNSSSSDNPQPYSGVYPNVTIGRTLLNASDLVNLEGNKSQVLVWTRSGQDGNVTIWNQAKNITVTNGTRWNNLFINGITGVLIPPGNLTTALTAINATAAENLLTSVQVPGSQQGNPGIVGGGAGGGASTSTVTESTTQSQSGDSASQTSTTTETSTQSSSESSSSDSSSAAESTTTETATDTATDTGSVTAPATDNGWARTTGRWWQPRQTGGVFRRQDQSGGGDQDQDQGQGQGGAAEPGPGGAGNATGSGGVSALEALQQAKGITLFVPNNEAFTSEVNQTLQGLQGNGTESSNLIMNHYINGTSLYSTQMTNDTNATTAAGEPLTFSRNHTGLFVSSGNSTAQITRPDVLLNNGVAHVISGVLLVQGRDEEAASSAYQSATSQAAVPTTETAPIGVVGAGGMMSTVTAQPLQSSASSSAASSSSEMSSSSGSQSQSESQSQSQTSSSAESTTTSTATSTQPPTSSNGGGGGAQSTVTETAATTQSAFVIRGLKVRNSALGMKGAGLWVSAMTSVVGGACLLLL